MGRKTRLKGKGSLVERASTDGPGPGPDPVPGSKPKPKPNHKSKHAASTASKSIPEPTPGSVLKRDDSSPPRPMPRPPRVPPDEVTPWMACWDGLAAIDTPGSVTASANAFLPPKPLVAAATVVSRPPRPPMSKSPLFISDPGPGSQGKAPNYKIDFVMCALRFRRDGTRNNGYWLHRHDYYRVFLQNDEFVFKPLFQSQLSSPVQTPSAMIQCGSLVFNISNLLTLEVNSITDSLSLQGETVHCHDGVSWVDLNDPETPKKWHSGSSLSRDIYNLPVEFAVLCDKIYCLSGQTTQRPRVFHTTIQGCHVYRYQLPDHLSKYEISEKIIPEPEKKRILVHLTTKSALESPQLYAWHPSTGYWELITTEIDACTWIDGSPILVHGVLYFYGHHHRTCFCAFDLGSIKWLQVRWPTPFPPDAAYVRTDKMFYLGDGLVCLPCSRYLFVDEPYPDEWGIRISFAVFHFHKTATPDDGPFVMFSHVFTKTIFAQHLAGVVDFLTPS